MFEPCVHLLRGTGPPRDLRDSLGHEKSFADAGWLTADLDQTDSAGNGNEMLLEQMAKRLKFHGL